MQGPATSLAYEPAEANVMGRPPRDITTERLVSFPLLTYSYIIVGLSESIICFGAYLWVFNNAGVKSKDIFLLDPKENLWLSRAENGDGNVAMSGDNTFTPEEQERIVREVTLLESFLPPLFHLSFSTQRNKLHECLHQSVLSTPTCSNRCALCRLTQHGTSR